jgi:hypothetical protein
MARGAGDVVLCVHGRADIGAFETIGVAAKTGVDGLLRREQFEGPNG